MKAYELVGVAPHGCKYPAAVMVDPGVNTGSFSADDTAKAYDAYQDVATITDRTHGRSAAVAGATVLPGNLADETEHAAGNVIVLSATIPLRYDLKADLLKAWRKRAHLLGSAGISRNSASPSCDEYPVIRL